MTTTPKSRVQRDDLVRHGIHWTRPGADVTLCRNLVSILDPRLDPLKGECSACARAREKISGA